MVWFGLLAIITGLAAEPSPVPVPPHVVAYVVEQGGEVRWSGQPRALHPRHPRDAPPDTHDIRSAGKSITALAVAAAIDDGQLTLGASPWEVLGLPAPPELDDLTVDDLLHMASPLHCDDWQRRSPGNEERMYRRRTWLRFVQRLPRDPAFTRGPQGHGRFRYCTAGVFLLGQVVQAAVGEPLDAYVRRRLFEPLGVGEVQWERSRAGEVQAGGQLSIAADDLARIGRMVIDGGRWGDRAVLSEERVTALLTPRHRLPRGPDTLWLYGGLWWATFVDVDDAPVPVWFMLGNGGNLVVLCRARDAVVVVQADAYNVAGAEQWGLDWVAELLERLDEPRARAPDPPPG